MSPCRPGRIAEEARSSTGPPRVLAGQRSQAARQNHRCNSPLHSPSCPATCTPSLTRPALPACRLSPPHSGGSNLGALESIVATPPPPGFDAAPPQLADPSQLTPHFDGAAAVPSILLLLLLLALSGNRILGLERQWSRLAGWWVEQRRYRRRQETIAAREQLERLFSEEGGSSGGGGAGGGSSGQ